MLQFTKAAPTCWDRRQVLSPAVLSGDDRRWACLGLARGRVHGESGGLPAIAYPERFAQEALGHNSKAVHRAYAKQALMKIPSLEEYERKAAAKVEAVA